MPGIFGLITKSSPQRAESELRRMAAILRHESFYVDGTWTDEDFGAYIGWTCRKGSFCDGMPLRTEGGEATLVFSGEEYSDPAIIQDLQERGHRFQPDDASYLVHMYQEDVSFPRQLNGRFQGFVYDREREFAILFNDRYGMHKIYYYEAEDAFYFASEAKAILAIRPETRQMDSKSLGEFIGCGCVLENRTLFKDIKVLPPASAWRFERGVLKATAQYFDPAEWEQQEELEPDEYHRRIREVFSKRLPRYLNGHEHLAVSLTGGLDTRMVMAWQRTAPGSLPCYTYGEDERECRDIKVARQVANECEQPHQTITIGKQFLSQFAHYAERSIYLSDAGVDVTRAPDLYFSEKAREIAPVRMTGLYGDEVLRPQIRAFKPMRVAPGLFDSGLLSQVAAARDTYNRSIDCHPTTFAAFRQAPWHHYGILALEQTQLTVRTPFLDNELVRTIFCSPRSVRENNDLRVKLIGDGSKKLQRIPTDRGFGGDSGPITSWITRNYLQFTFRAEYAFDYGMPQWLARANYFCSPLKLERLFLGRHKMFHYRSWYSDILAPYVREMLLDSRTLSRSCFDRGGVEHVVHGHIKGDRNYTTEIHRLLSIELIHRLFLDV